MNAFKQFFEYAYILKSARRDDQLKKYTKSGRIKFFPLKKEDLLELVELIERDIPQFDHEDDLEISANLQNVSIRETRVQDFLSHKELPDRLNILSIGMIGWNNENKIDVSIQLRIYIDYISLNINGFNETWVRGKYSQIEEFLNEKNKEEPNLAINTSDHGQDIITNGNKKDIVQMINGPKKSNDISDIIYKKSGKIKFFSLKKEDLLRLTELIKQDLPQSHRKEDLEISADLPNISIRENDVADFLSHKELPDKLNILSVRMIGWNDERKINKSITLTIYMNYISLYIDGFNEPWVLGKYSQLENFLNERRKQQQNQSINNIKKALGKPEIQGLIAVLVLIVTIITLIK